MITISSLGFAQLSADEILATIVNSQRGGQSGRSTISMQVMKAGKETRFEIHSVSDGNERSLIQVVAPAKDAGQAFLTSGDNLWIYNPRLKRTLRLPPSGRSDSFLGSDISYSDLGGRDLETDYSATIVEQSAETVTLELIPAELAPTPYGKVLIIADRQSLAPLKQTFFDQRETPVREIIFDNFVMLDELSFPTYLEVRNLLKEGDHTIIEISDYSFGMAIPESCFQQQALERGCQ